MDPAPEGSSGSDQETVWLGPPAQKERLPHVLEPMQLDQLDDLRWSKMI